jgi:hypothetical protein
MSPTPTTEVDVECPCGKPRCYEGVLTADGGYIKRSWHAYKLLFSGHTRFIAIRPWDYIKSKVKWVEIHDMAGHVKYHISVEDAEKYGQRWTPPPNKSEHTWGGCGTVFRVPTERWTATQWTV